MKRIFLAAFSMLLAGASLYAQGAAPNSTEPVKVTGKVTIADNGWAALASGGTTYNLLYPHYSTAEVPIKNGDTISVTGYVVPGPRWADEKAVFLRVSQAEVGGKTFVFAGRLNGPRGPRGGRGADDDGSGCYGYGPMMRDGRGNGRGHMPGRWR
ncbi:MAG: hypothetical protein JXD23_11810 [Spirochaetales bacterium]|nr:hypothetical protein [Spirochaetales bacterium]